jgi:hypothetical protein
MRKKEGEVRKLFLKIRMNHAEMEQLKNLKKKTPERSISNYVRKVVLQRPVIVKYRNQTGDEFLKEMIQLKKELNAIGNNFNQTVHKLHILDKIPEFRNWIKCYYGLHQSVVNKVEEINSRINQLYEQWLQK